MRPLHPRGRRGRRGRGPPASGSTHAGRGPSDPGTPSMAARKAVRSTSRGVPSSSTWRASRSSAQVRGRTKSAIPTATSGSTQSHPVARITAGPEDHADRREGVGQDLVVDPADVEAGVRAGVEEIRAREVDRQADGRDRQHGGRRQGLRAAEAIPRLREDVGGHDEQDEPDASAQDLRAVVPVGPAGRGGRSASFMAARASTSPATSVSMCPASASRDRLPVRKPATTSTPRKAQVIPSTTASRWWLPCG